ncbi:hypothetical protein ASPACDRAFT_53601 [Aspergillus aculeatus ATCC 16872]|uniref:Protein kinase domain-containing protein n=1 Tax=Aspergillus aculeatus (strain ATCC 16872 / CBS 172.66 / WB 5094) TaxID=690307 RepID=A0A1L9WPM6_ASPA1|nr:uncharacterized protein ASPACDRAFT_53601 [Aspergillus aculeatus ATCC 16872]OJJ98119.1 hypothetical protein ASPACDRAFT_53601 [Aspergillus aculeatus ATCC 16872]
MPDYAASRYYPTRVGEVLKNQYQIVGKLGFGTSSTVWLARDMNYRRYVTLKIYITAASIGQHLNDEFNMYQRIERGSRNHPGRGAIRPLLDSFDINGPHDKHRCLVHPPLWESALTFLYRNPVRRLPVPVLASILKRLCLALDYLHTECQIIHTDIKADNIMFGVGDESVFRGLVKEELENPSPRKELDGRTTYVSRELGLPGEWGAPVLCDFGSAVPGDVEHLEDIQPDIYRAPEIWNVYEGGSLAHLAEIVCLHGPPPPSLLARGRLKYKFFSDEGKVISVVISSMETTLEGQEKADFLRLVRKMLQWDPAQRSSARELLEDEWICRHTRN